MSDSKLGESKRVLYIVCTDSELHSRYQAVADTIKSDVWEKKFAPSCTSDTSTLWYEMNSRDSGLDLFMPITNVCPPGITTMLDLGVSVSAYDEVYLKHQPPIESGYTAATPLSLFLIVRSSTGKKTPLRQANAPGLIDQGYRGNLMAAVDNTSDEPFRAEEGARYFQLMACDGIPFDEVRIVDKLSVTERSAGGFGSTGK